MCSQYYHRYWFAKGTVKGQHKTTAIWKCLSVACNVIIFQIKIHTESSLSPSNQPVLCTIKYCMDSLDSVINTTTDL